MCEDRFLYRDERKGEWRLLGGDESRRRQTLLGNSPRQNFRDAAY
jgi:hypothetical protein